MQFSCDSCKTQLQIADEKVRGKRLIVRCKRCGAKIAISDPALANAAPRVVAHPPTTLPRPVAASAPAPAARATAPRGPNTDTESTRAMETDVLEKALLASKADDPAAVQNGVPAPSRPRPPADTPAWFAMLHGKQEGPLTRAQLEEKTGRGEMGPRTYLWKDGMQSWQRAKDLPELTELFPAAAMSSVPPPPVPPPPSVSPRRLPRPRTRKRIAPP